MNQFIASNIRHLREHRTWTQEHLAAVADVTTRTVQRLEAGEGAQPETLRSIAAAFDVGVETLRFDTFAHLAAHFGVSREELTPESVAQRSAEIDAKYIKVPVDGRLSS